MATKPNGGIVGQSIIPGTGQLFGVYSATAAAELTSAGLYSVSTGNIATKTLAPVDPIITGISYTDSSYNVLSGITAVSSNSLGNILITGTNFRSNTTAYIAGIRSANTYVVNSTQINAIVPSLAAAGSYSVMVSSSDGVSILSNINLVALDVPTFQTATTFNYSNNTAFSTTISATGAVSYTVLNGSLPGNVTLNSSTGVLAGNVFIDAIYPYRASWSFDVQATNLQGLSAVQTHYLTIAGVDPVISYVVVGGGGGGGLDGQSSGTGGGGAGGVNISTVTAPQLAFSQLSYSPIKYQATIGAGAAGKTWAPTGVAANPGNSTSFQGNITTGPTSGVVPIALVAGGGGGASTFNNPGAAPGFLPSPGGSGGGGAVSMLQPSPGATFTQPGGTGTSGQGNPGGFGRSQLATPNNYANGGGGGGAGSAGSDGVFGVVAASGGSGVLWPYSNSYFGGGGGGNNGSSGGPGGSGSMGGGPGGIGGGGGGYGNQTPNYPFPTQIGNGGPIGTGPFPYSSNGSPQQVNTPNILATGRGGDGGLGTGGGGGGGRGPATGSAGGSGIVALAVPNSLYAAGATLSPAPAVVATTPPAAPGQTVIVFTASGSYTIPAYGPIWTNANAGPYVYGNGTAISTTLRAYNAASYAVAAGNTLPSGISLTSSGILSGTFTTAANSVFYIDAVSPTGATTSRMFIANILITSYTVNYLVVAGGGGAGSAANPGDSGGAGGAGGLLAGSTTFLIGSTYTIQIGGGGGAGQVNPADGVGQLGTSGFSSNITSAAPGFTPITTAGGGYGGAAITNTSPQPASTFAGGSGGSGGGGSSNGPLALNGPGGSSTPGQGNPGGAGLNVASSGGSGGGGGAGGPGVTATGSPGGNGGSASTWTYTGPATYYAGGGGGGAFYGPGPGSGITGGLGGGQPPASPALKGGGGDGGNGRATGSMVDAAGKNATPNTGGGGGGGSYGPAGRTVGGAGGSGVVKLAVPTTYYPGSAPGATVSTPPAAPGYTVLTYNSSGTYTA
jgi:hypothetical protein